MPEALFSKRDLILFMKINLFGIRVVTKVKNLELDCQIFSFWPVIIWPTAFQIRKA